MRVRAAEPGDVDWMLDELRQFAAWVERKRPLYDAPHAREWLPRLIAGHFVRVAHTGEARAGFLVGLVGAHPLNPGVRTLTELFWWVAAGHRDSRAGLLLLEAFVEWGKAHADWILLSLEAESLVNEETLNRRGFVLKERGYLLEV